MSFGRFSILTFSTILILCFSFVTHGQVTGGFEWAISIGGDSHCRGFALTTDQNGNVFSTGHFVSSVDLNSGIGVDTHLSNGQSDIYITKLDQNGNYVWGKSLGGYTTDEGLGIALDQAGSVYVTGRFTDSMDVDPGIDTNMMNDGGAFVLKLDNDGNFIWARNFPDNSMTWGHTISLDSYDNVFVSGWFVDTVDFNPEVGVFELESNGLTDVFIVKFDVNGNFVWANSFGGVGNDYCAAITHNPKNDLYLTGNFSDTVDFDMGVGSHLLTAELNKVYILKLDSTGNFVWAKAFGSTSFNCGNDIAIDLNGNILTTGYFKGAADFNPGVGSTILTSNGGNDIFIQKLDSNGNFIWANSFGGFTSDVGYSISTDSNGDIAFTGEYADVVDFDPSVGVYNLYSPLAWSNCIVEFDSTGNLLWAVSLDVQGRSLAFDLNNDVLITGFFGDSVDFDPGGNTHFLYADNISELDAFVLKLSELNIAQSETYTINGSIGISPNPSNANQTINVIIYESANMEIILYDIQGKLVHEVYSEFTQAGEHKINSDLEELEFGIYFYMVSLGADIAIIKIIKT